MSRCSAPSPTRSTPRAVAQDPDSLVVHGGPAGPVGRVRCEPQALIRRYSSVSSARRSARDAVRPAARSLSASRIDFTYSGAFASTQSSSASGSIGTTAAMGLPLLVTTAGLPDLATSSTTALALLARSRMLTVGTTASIERMYRQL